MSIAAPPRRQTRIAAVGSRKRFAEVRNFPNATDKFTRRMPSLLAVKFNPYWSESLDSPGTVVDFAQVRLMSLSVHGGDIDTDGVAERTLPSISITPVRDLIDAWNVPNANRAQYWTAGVADVAPALITNSLYTAGDNRGPALVGFEDGVFVPLNASVSGEMFVSAGVDEAKNGSGARVPGLLGTDYHYPLTPATNTLHVGRGGGINAQLGEDILSQRASKFGTRESIRAAEMNPARALFLTVVDSITNNGMVAGANEPLLYEIMESDGRVIWRTQQADTVNLIEPDPVVVCRGSAFLKVTGSSGGSFSAGSVGMYGDTRVA